MKNLLSTLLLLLCVTSLAAAQDTITKTNGEALQVKVLEITLGEVKYKKFDNLTGPTYVLSKADVQLIQYENNTTDSFNMEKNEIRETTASTVNLYSNGQNDARVYYRNYTSAGTGTIVATLLSPIGGLVTALACSSTTPKEHNLTYPDTKLMSDQNYSMGYRNEAKRIKSRKVWKNFGIGMGVNLAVILLVASSGN